MTDLNALCESVVREKNARIEELEREVVMLRSVLDPDAEHARLVLLKDAMDAAIAEVSPKMDAFYGKAIDAMEKQLADCRASLQLACDLAQRKIDEIEMEDPHCYDFTAERAAVDALRKAGGL